MSHDAVELAALRASLDASQRQVRRVLHVLRATGTGLDPDLCFCLAWMNPGQGHIATCLAARRELLALRTGDAGPPWCIDCGAAVRMGEPCPACHLGDDQ